MEVQGYPKLVIFVVLGIGIPLAMLRPYATFLSVVVILTAANVDTFNQTRISGLGPYLNLGDTCLLIVLTALFFEKFRLGKPIFVPHMVLILFFVLTIAALQSFWKLGWTYETARAYRWGLQVPFAIFIGANLVDSTERAKGLVGALLCGATLGALQHLLFAAQVWHSRSLSMQGYHMMRTIAFWAGCMPSAFLVTAVVWKMPADKGKKCLYLIAGTLFLTSVFLTQTRSLWLATAGAALCLLFLFREKNRLVNLMRFTFIAAIVLLGAAWICQEVMPGLDVLQVATDRIEHLGRDSTTAPRTSTRARAFTAETGSWLNGTLVFGRGLCFMQTIRNPESGPNRVAFGHLGYVTYLTQMGLIGLLVYGFYLPLRIIRAGRLLWRRGSAPVIRYLGLLGTASILSLCIMFLMSSSFLNLGYFAPGVLYGALWSLARNERKRINERPVAEGAISGLATRRRL